MTLHIRTKADINHGSILLRVMLRPIPVVDDEMHVIKKWFCFYWELSWYCKVEYVQPYLRLWQYWKRHMHYLCWQYLNYHY